MATATAVTSVPTLDTTAEIERIARALREQIGRRLHRRGAVLGLSGGIDSSTTAALLVEALGPERVLGLLMPEGESHDESLTLGREVAEHLGIRTVVEDIGPVLEASGCYRRRDEAIRRAVPAYDAGWKAALVRGDVLSKDAVRTYALLVEAPDGTRQRARLGSEDFMQIVAATSMKQRTRKMLEYYHADRLGWAVAGTPNRLEYELGFFVKNGDGAADVKPIAHLYKTQVYQLAEALGIPEDIRTRPPTTDTYPIEGSQDEFFFPLPLPLMDVCLWGRTEGRPPEEIARLVDLAPEQVLRVYRDIDARRRAAEPLHLAPLLVTG